jgi:transposase
MSRHDQHSGGPCHGRCRHHGNTHHAAVLDQAGRQLGDREFLATPAGYRALLEWLRDHGQLERVGVEGTGAYGAGLGRHLRVRADVRGFEVDRPDRKGRRARGKSHPLDAYAAARLRCPARPQPTRRPETGESRRSARCAWPVAALSRPAPKPPTR